MKKALITGGAGFIGSNLCEFLLKKIDLNSKSFDAKLYKDPYFLKKLLALLSVFSTILSSPLDFGDFNSSISDIK